MTDHYEMYTTTITPTHSFLADFPHTHPYHEIFMLLEGSLDYLVEGTIFPLKAGDIVLISAGDPHSKYVYQNAPLKIFVLNLATDFFTENLCPQYEHIFTSHLSTEHKISAETARETGLYQAYKRLSAYTSDFTNTHTPVVKCVVTEMMYLLNQNKFSSNYIVNPQIQQIIDYINAHYTQKITLDEIAEKLFLSKYYICKLFKKHTGITVKSYITQKRLAKAAHLTEEGCNITSACIQAGFPDYSSFYHAFLKENQKAPSSLLK